MTYILAIAAFVLLVLWAVLGVWCQPRRETRLFSVLVLVALVLGVVFGVWCQRGADASAMEDLARYRATYLYRSGFTTLGGKTVTYDFQSFDGGETWWEIERREGRAVIILGPANEEVLEELRAMDELVDRLEAHGPLNLQNPADVELAKRAGFEVVPIQQH